VLTLPQNPKSTLLSNFLEEDGAPSAFEKNVVKVPTKKNSVVTVKITF
jgi:hypothetical protein